MKYLILLSLILIGCEDSDSQIAIVEDGDPNIAPVSSCSEVDKYYGEEICLPCYNDVYPGIESEVIYFYQVEHFNQGVYFYRMVYFVDKNGCENRQSIGNTFPHVYLNR